MTNPANLDAVVETMRELSLQTNPQDMVKVYGARIGKLLAVERRISLSRRGLSSSRVRVTRSTTWQVEIDPWKEVEKLPILEGGLLAELIYRGEPVVMTDFEYSASDPAAAYFEGCRSLMAVPLFDAGESLNMVVLLAGKPNAFSVDELPDAVWRSNLFGRATNNLVLKDELARAYQTLDREIRAVGELQRSMLPAKLPTIPGLDLAAWYQPAARAGGDYYDFFPLDDDRWGIIIADVSGHGTPAAVVMAVTHCIAHLRPQPLQHPSQFLDYLNRQLLPYCQSTGRFVTAFYGVYDAANRTFLYARAGHNPPRIKRCEDGSLLILDRAEGLPLGLVDDAEYTEAAETLHRGDQMILYTDGVTETHNAAGELFGSDRLDESVSNCMLQATSLLDNVLENVTQFAAGRPPDDDCTLIVALVS